MKTPILSLVFSALLLSASTVPYEAVDRGEGMLGSELFEFWEIYWPTAPEFRVMACRSQYTGSIGTGSIIQLYSGQPDPSATWYQLNIAISWSIACQLSYIDENGDLVLGPLLTGPPGGHVPRKRK